MRMDLDLNKDESKWFHCLISLCGPRGSESVEYFKNMARAEHAKRTIDRCGCGNGHCDNQHYALSLPRGHIRNIQQRQGIEQSAYLRWLISTILEKQKRLRKIA